MKQNIVTRRFSFDMKADVGFEDITSLVQDGLAETKLQEGIATVFVVGSTGAVCTTEYEPGLMKDIPRALDMIAPKNVPYEHHNTWHDDNGRSHVKAAIIGPSLVVPYAKGRLCLGTWQQIVVLNLDTTPRKREVVIQYMGE